MTPNKYQLSLILFLFIWQLNAQNNTSSNYSRFGIGLLENNADVTNASMGYAGVAMTSDGYLNMLNPASYSALDSARFLFNIQGRLSFSEFETESDKQSNINGNLESVSIGFKAGRNWGMGFSLSPYTSIGYSISSEKHLLGTTDKYPVEYIGEGGISQLSWYNGFTLFKGLSLGVGTSYLWGSSDMIEISDYPDIVGETIYNERNYHVSTFLLEYGLQYHQAIGLNTLSLGITGNFATELNSSFEQRIYNDYSSELSTYTEDIDNCLIPQSTKIGLAFETAKGITMAADYRYANWSASELSISNGDIRDTHGGSIGFQYAPQRLHRSLLKRMEYRVGAFYNEQYFTIHNQEINDKGVTAGITLPLQNGSRINIGYEYKTSGTTSSNLIKESYNTIKLGLTFNENWFQRIKFQ